MVQHERWLEAKVIEKAALEKITIHFLITIPELQRGTRREPVGEPSLPPASGAPHPASEQIAVVGIAVTISPEIPINEAGRKFFGMRSADDFGAKVNLRQHGQSWHIQAHIERRPAGEQR